MQSIGERIHLVRLHIGWSPEECAYRTTIESNANITPTLWQEWERCSDGEAGNNGLQSRLNAIATILAVDPEWLKDGDNVAETAPTERVIAFPSRATKSD